MYTITQTAFAKIINKTKSAVSQLVRDGKLPVDGKKIVMPDAERAYHLLKSGLGLAAAAAAPEVLEPGQFPIKSDGDASMQDLLNAKVKKENALGDLHDVNLKKIQGNLISLDDVCKAVTSVGEIVRNELINLPTKIASTLVDLTATEIQYALDDAINEILTNLYDMQHEYTEQSNPSDTSPIFSGEQA